MARSVTDLNDWEGVADMMIFQPGNLPVIMVRERKLQVTSHWPYRKEAILGKTVRRFSCGENDSAAGDEGTGSFF